MCPIYGPAYIYMLYRVCHTQENDETMLAIKGS